jgi:hypothetical protein
VGNADVKHSWTVLYTWHSYTRPFGEGESESERERLHDIYQENID